MYIELKQIRIDIMLLERESKIRIQYLTEDEITLLQLLRKPLIN